MLGQGSSYADIADAVVERATLRAVIVQREIADRWASLGGSAMTPRWIVFDLFGEYVRFEGGEVRLRALTALLECFDIGENTVRV